MKRNAVLGIVCWAVCCGGVVFIALACKFVGAAFPRWASAVCYRKLDGWPGAQDTMIVLSADIRRMCVNVLVNKQGYARAS